MNDARRLAILAFVVSVAYWPGIISAATAPRWWALAIGLPLVMRTGPFEVVDHPFGMWFLAGLAGAAASVLWASATLNATLQLYWLLLICAAFFAAAYASSIEPALCGFAAGLCVSSALAMAQWLGWNAIPHLGPAGLFYNSDALAEFAAPLFVWAFLTKRGIFALGALIPLLICHSRMAPVAAAVGLFVGMSGWRRWAMAVVLIEAVLAITFLPGKIGSAFARVADWRIVAGSTFSLLGHGIGSASPQPGRMWVHSDALQLVYELGLLAAPFMMIGAILLRIGRGIDERPRSAAFAAAACLVVFSYPLHVPATAFLCAVLAGSVAGSRALLWGDGSGGRDKGGAGSARELAGARSAGLRAVSV